MGSSDALEARQVIELFQFLTSVLGKGNRLHVITATRMAMSNQIKNGTEELKKLYTRLELPERLAAEDYIRNQEILDQCYELGIQLTGIK
jgi:hypothetical protein